MGGWELFKKIVGDTDCHEMIFTVTVIAVGISYNDEMRIMIVQYNGK